MKLKIFITLLIVIYIPNLVFANNYSAINYTITPVFANNIPFIKVEAEIKGQLSDKIVINFPRQWAGAEYSKQIKNIKLNYPQGKIKFKQSKIIITIPETSGIVLSYEIYQKPGNPAHVHETIIRKDLVHGN